MKKINLGAVPNQPATSQDIAALMNGISSGAYPWWYPDGAKGLAIDAFTYSANFLPLGASASLNQQINISGDSAFVILSAVMVETATDNTTFLPQRPLLVSLLDSGSGRQFSNNAIPADGWFGDAYLPGVWPIPKILAPNATLTVGLQNLEATARNVYAIFIGFKIFSFVPTYSGTN